MMERIKRIKQQMAAPLEGRLPRAGKYRDKPLVRVVYVPDRVAYLIVEGPQQSELRWTHNGNTFIVSNESFERIKP